MTLRQLATEITQRGAGKVAIEDVREVVRLIVEIEVETRLERDEGVVADGPLLALDFRAGTLYAKRMKAGK